MVIRTSGPIRRSGPPIAVLEDALARCRREDMRTPSVERALTALASRATEAWPSEQFRRALATTDRDEDRWQLMNASLNAIKLVC